LPLRRNRHAAARLEPRYLEQRPGKLARSLEQRPGKLTRLLPHAQLRASFCTYLRSADDIDEELLKSCAYVVLAPSTAPSPPRAEAHSFVRARVPLRVKRRHAMKHQVATGGSDNYDKAAQ
jgi:hypothetical protein